VSSLSQGLEAGIRVLKTAVQSIESNIIRSRKETVDKKTVSVASRLVELLEKTMRLLDVLSRRIQHVEDGLVTISNYTYIFRTSKEVVLVRTRPEHVVLSLDLESNAVSLKTRDATLSVSPNSLTISIRSKLVKISPLSEEQFTSKRDELRMALKTIEKAVYRRLLPLIEQKLQKV